MIEQFINNKSTGIIQPDTVENRARAKAFNTLVCNHYKIKLTLTFKKVDQ